MNITSDPFVKTLFKVKLEGPNRFPNAANILEQQLDNIGSMLQEYKLKEADLVREFAADTFNEIQAIEQEIWELYDKAYARAQELSQRIAKDKGTPATKGELEHVKHWENISEYYGNVINQIDDAKFILLEFHASYYPSIFVNDEKKFQLMKSILPATNPARKKVESKLKIKTSHAPQADGGKKGKRRKDPAYHQLKNIIADSGTKHVTPGNIKRLADQYGITMSDGTNVKIDWCKKHFKKEKVTLS